MLSRRLGLLVAAVLLAALSAFGLLADRLFEQAQRAQLDDLLQRELQRVQELVTTSQLGASFLREEGRNLTLQFVDQEGVVQLPPGEGAALPLHEEPTLLEAPPRLVSSVPWRLPSGRRVGTIRASLEVESFVAAQRDLNRSLVVSGVVIALVTGLLVLGVVQRALAPLRRLARHAARMDPARPELTEPLMTAGRHDEVADLATALQRALDAVRARQQAERDALAEVAHELAAPLTLVAGRLRALEARHGADPSLTAARAAADELLYTSQDLLTLARGELERGVELHALDLASLARGVGEEIGDVPVRTASKVEVLGDAGRLRQLVRNLLRNAVQVSGGVDGVDLCVTREGDEAVLTVADRGPGLPAGAEDRVFQRHVSGRSGGTGLGLSVAREIAERHDATLRGASRPGGGAVFTLRMAALEAQWVDSSDGAP